MINIKILAFGVVKDFFGSSAIRFELPDGASVAMMRNALEQQYPGLKQLSSYMVALNSEYALPDSAIAANDEVAIIPPVSGG